MFYSALVMIELAIWFIARVLFFVWNYAAFQEFSMAEIVSAFLLGFRVDLVTLGLLTAPACLVWLILSFQYQFSRVRWTKARVGMDDTKPQQKAIHRWGLRIFLSLFLLPIFVALSLTLGDIEFSHFMGRRLSVQSMAIFQESEGKWLAILSHDWFLFSLGVLLTMVSFYLVWRVVKKWRSRAFRDRPAILFMVVLLTFLGARGGWQKKPLGFSQAQIFRKPILNLLVTNSGFTLLKSLHHDDLPPLHYFDESQGWISLLTGASVGESKMQGLRWWESGKDQMRPNIVVIIVESLSLQYMGKPFGDDGYTPFLDSLAARGIFLPNTYANARRSIEGVGAILSGVPALMNEPFLSSVYNANEFLRIGSFLGKNGYASEFFHGGHNGTMYFDSFMQALGIEKYFGFNEYNNAKDDDGTWGIYDRPFLQRMKTELDQTKAPFFAAVFTLSSHHPFKLPDGLEDKYPKGPAEILPTVRYMDDSVRDFFESASQSSWYANTLFVITGDHTFKGFRPEFENEMGDHRIPLILFSPRWEKSPELKPQVDTKMVASQIDILPTLVDFLDLHVEKRNPLGRSIFWAGPRSAVFFEDGKYHLVLADRFLTSARGDDFSEFKPDDAAEKNPRSLSPNDPGVLELKAVQQYFYEALSQNKIDRPPEELAKPFQGN